MAEAAVEILKGVIPGRRTRDTGVRSGLRRIAATFQWRDELWGPGFALRSDSLERGYLERQAVGRDSGIRC